MWKDEGLYRMKRNKIKRAYNLRRDIWDQRDLIYSIPSEILFKELPRVVDWRSLCAPVGDQGRAGACTSFACTRMLGCDRNKQKLPPFAYSELWLYYRTRLK